MSMLQLVDQLGRLVSFPENPKKVISLVPSISELVVELTGGEILAGRTKFCVAPESIMPKIPVIGGTKNLNFDKIREINPDIIIANKEENRKEDIEILEKEFNVWISDVNNFTDAIIMINTVGHMIGEGEKAIELNQSISTSYGFYLNQGVHPKKVLYLIWKDPIMAAGRKTFIHEMLNMAGYTNIIRDNRYPHIDPEVINKEEFDFVFLSSEPFPFNEKHKSEIQDLFPGKEIVLVDGSYFSWYGSRMRDSFPYFSKLREITS